MAPCAWDVDPVELGVCAGWADYSETVKANALTLASSFLWGATGRRFGLCPVTVRPGQSRYLEPAVYQAFPVTPGYSVVPGTPYLFGGRWFNAGCGSPCCGSSLCGIVLRGPVASVDEVMVNGELVPATSYRVDIAGGAWWLVRVDGLCWPTCQDFRLEADQPGTFEVTYRLGEALPEALALATALLACEYATALTGGACKLPAKMTRLSRQGVEIEVEPPAPGEGRTGIREVDDVIATFNPTGRKYPPVILSPDLDENCDRVTVVPVGGS